MLHLKLASLLIVILAEQIGLPEFVFEAVQGQRVSCNAGSYEEGQSSSVRRIPIEFVCSNLNIIPFVQVFNMRDFY